jgi:hypothetical protein
MARDGFQDKAGLINGGALYEWDISHETEEPQEKTENFERTALTSGVGFVRQQGAPQPTVYKLHGWATKTQIEKMEAFYNACAGIGTPARTIFWQDISGTLFEVLITQFAPQRSTGRMVGRGGGSIVFQYSITLEVV